MDITLNIKNCDELKASKGQIFAFLNIRSVYNNLSELQADFNNSNLVALGLSETWLNQNILSSMVNIDGYKAIRLDRQINKRGGGVMIYLRNDCTWDLLPTHSLISNENIELLTIIVHRKFFRDICLSIVYLPPHINKLVAINTLDEVADCIFNKGYQWILGGDFNIDLKHGGNAVKKAINSFASKNGLKQIITESTRCTPTTATCIDHIYISDDMDLVNKGVIKYGLSDHDLTFLVYKRISSKEKVNSRFKCRIQKNYSYERLEIEINNTDWAPVFRCNNSEECWDLIYNNYINCLDNIAPISDISINKIKPNWVTSEIISLIRQRDNNKRTADSLNQNQDYINFKLNRNKIKRKVIKAKKYFITHKLKEHPPNSKKYWDELNEICPTGKSSGKRSIEIIHLKNADTTDINPEYVPNTFNNFFASIGTELSGKISTDNTDYLANCARPPDYEPMQNWTKIQDIEVKYLIKQLDLSKNSNIKDINSKML